MNADLEEQIAKEVSEALGVEPARRGIQVLTNSTFSRVIYKRWSFFIRVEDDFLHIGAASHRAYDLRDPDFDYVKAGVAHIRGYTRGKRAARVV